MDEVDGLLGGGVDGGGCGEVVLEGLGALWGVVGGERGTGPWGCRRWS